MIKWWIVMNHSKHATPEAGTASVYSVYTARRRPLFCNCRLCNSLRIRAWTNTMESHRSDEIHAEWCCTCGISAPLFALPKSTVLRSVEASLSEHMRLSRYIMDWWLVVVFRIHLDSIPYLPAFGPADYILKDVSIVLLFLLLAERNVSIQKKLGL